MLKHSMIYEGEQSSKFFVAVDFKAHSLEPPPKASF